MSGIDVRRDAAFVDYTLPDRRDPYDAMIEDGLAQDNVLGIFPESQHGDMLVAGHFDKPRSRVCSACKRICSGAPGQVLTPTSPRCFECDVGAGLDGMPTMAERRGHALARGPGWQLALRSVECTANPKYRAAEVAPVRPSFEPPTRAQQRRRAACFPPIMDRHARASSSFAAPRRKITRAREDFMKNLGCVGVPAGASVYGTEGMEEAPFARMAAERERWEDAICVSTVPVLSS